MRAEKTFTETLSTNALDVEGLLNGVNTSDAITLQGKQDWQGLPTFADLTIAELLQVNGCLQITESYYFNFGLL